MKKFLSLILSAVMFLWVLPVFAESGGVAGNIYSTDIRAYINDVEVESYNIGGKTAVVLEDIIKERPGVIVYNDYTRTLRFSSLSPDYIVESVKNDNIKSGNIIGKIYETDIKALIYDVVVPSYNIGGKTAVAIEDLGGDKEFSKIGGRYNWDEESRTISLEFLYESTTALPKDKKIILTANEGMTEMTAVFEDVIHCGGGQQILYFPNYINITDDSELEVILPIKAGGEIIGYYFRRPSNTYGFTAFSYYYPEKIAEEEKRYTPISRTREEVISHFLECHSVGTETRFDTDDYSFVYITVAGTRWSVHYLLQVWNDGTYIDYMDEIFRNNRSLRNLTIDEENERVTFRYQDRYTSEWYDDYEIDLKSGEIKTINNPKTDMGL